MFALDRGIKLDKTGSDLASCQPSDSYWNMRSMYGGWILSVAFESVSSQPNFRGELLSINASFIEAVQLEGISIRTRLLQSRSKTDFWRVELLREDDAGRVLFTADIVVGERRATDIDYSGDAPIAAAPESYARLDTNGFPEWLNRYELRIVKGVPLTKNDNADSLAWARDRDLRPLDSKGLVAISDSFIMRPFLLSEEIHMGATVSFSLYVFADNQTLSSIGSDYLLLEGNSKIVKQGMYDQGGYIWSPSGQLLAATNQLGLYR